MAMADGHHPQQVGLTSAPQLSSVSIGAANTTSGVSGDRRPHMNYKRPRV